MNRTALAAALVAGTMMAGTAHADISFDFTTLNGGVEGDLSTSSVTVNGVVANAYTYAPLTSYTDSDLWLRNSGGGEGSSNAEKGLGVCSSGETNCSGSGDMNELSDQSAFEVIRLTKPDNADEWTSLWVSSLDSGGSNGNETGTVYFSDTEFLDLTSATGYTYDYYDVETANNGDILDYINPTADELDSKYVFFRAGPNEQCNVKGCTSNNDHLIWKGTLSEVPIPAALPMLLAAVGGLGFAGWRSNRRPA